MMHLTQFMVQRALEQPNTKHLGADERTHLTDGSLHYMYFEKADSVLSRPSTINDSVINSLPQMECNVLLDKFSTVTETRKRFSVCHWAMYRVQTQYLQRSIKQEVNQRQRNLQSCFTACGGRAYPIRVEGCNPPMQMERKY